MTDSLDILEPRDWRELRDQFQNVEPFPSISIDNFLTAEAACGIAESYPTYSEAHEMGMEFLSVNSKKKIQVTEEEKLPEPVAGLSRMLASSEFRTCLTEMTGIPSLRWDDHLGGGGKRSL